METSGMPDTYDRLLGNLKDLPDVTHTQTSIVKTTVPIVGHQQTTIIQTYRQAGVGDFIFVETIGREGAFRYVLMPEAANAVARQRDSLKTIVQRKHGRRLAAERKARGEQPAFMKNQPRRRKAGKKR